MERCPHLATAGQKGGADNCESPSTRPPPPSAGSLPVAPATSSPPHQPEFILHAQVLTMIMMCTVMQKYLRGRKEIRALATLLRANSLLTEEHCSAASL